MNDFSVAIVQTEIVCERTSRTISICNEIHTKSESAENWSLKFYMNTIIYLIFTLRTLLSLISAFRGFSSIQGTFSGLNQVQLILLLPLVGAFIPTRVIQFIAGLKLALNLLAYVEVVDMVPIDFRKLDYNQPNSYLYLINFTSQSSILNFINFAYPILLMLLPYSTLSSPPFV